MKSKEEFLQILRQLKPYLAEKYSVVSMGLFGSVARDEATPDSDVDLLLDFEQPIGWEIVDLGDELEAALGAKVDIISPKHLRPRFWQAIQEDLLYV